MVISVDAQAIAARLEPRFGKAVHRWVAALPERLSALTAEWELEIGPEVNSGSSSVVLSCVGPQGEAILKLSPDARGVAEQADALRQLRRAVASPPSSQPAGAMLMEAIHPGTPVRGLPAPPAATEYASFLADLHAAGDPAAAPRKLTDWMSWHFTVASFLGGVGIEQAPVRVCRIARDLD